MHNIDRIFVERCNIVLHSMGINDNRHKIILELLSTLHNNSVLIRDDTILVALRDYVYELNSIPASQWTIINVVKIHDKTWNKFKTFKAMADTLKFIIGYNGTLFNIDQLVFILGKDYILEKIKWHICMKSI